jgi:chromosome segregation ATPase
MLKSIHIKNFENHKDSTLNLSSGVNIIIGDNDTGKSAILRSIEQHSLNPVGDDYRSNFVSDKEETVIEIKTDKDDPIKKIRSKYKNQYQINNEKPLESFGKGKIPDKIKSLLNIEGINIQPQKEPAFLLTSNSGQIAKYLNQIVNLEEIDESLSFMRKKKRGANNKIESLKTQDLEPLEKELQQYESLETWENRLNEVEKDVTHFKKLEEIHEKGLSLLNNLKGLYSELKESKRIVGYKSKIPSLMKLNKNSNDLKIRIQRAFNLIVEMGKQRNNKKKYKNILQFKNEVNNIVKLDDERKKLKDKISKAESRLYILKTEKKRKEDLKETIKTKKIKLRQIMPKICPFCDQKIKEKK